MKQRKSRKALKNQRKTNPKQIKNSKCNNNPKQQSKKYKTTTNPKKTKTNKNTHNKILENETDEKKGNWNNCKKRKTFRT